MRHPSPGALLELHFAEAAGSEKQALEAHVRACRACGAFVEDVRRLELALGAGPDDAPPRDGLERVLARVAEVRPARARRAEWARLAAPSAAALLAAGWAIQAGSERVQALEIVQSSLPAPLSELAGLALAAAAVLLAGSLVTLALAPVLILESNGRP